MWRHIGLILIASALWMVSHACHADRGDWIELNSDGFTILKRYGLPEGQRLTMTLFPLVRSEPAFVVNRFYQWVGNDLPRTGRVVDHYQTEIAELAKLSVIITLRRYRDHRGEQTLVYYQGFYRPDLNQMWFVRTDLNDNLDLLVSHYEEMIDIILKRIGI
jgi:hypothetical protein